MSRQDVTLHDKFDLGKTEVLLNGTQALVRLMLMQRARDLAAGLNTAGFVTGYRGSPLGAVDMQMMRAKADLEASHVVFQPGLNEDLAATAVWGTQQAELRGQGRYDGVFALWYGKGPGVDRSGDAIRHGNLAGTSPRGGVVMALGDDHTGESSTTCHQSDWAMVDAYVPVLSPAGVQEILDFGLYGFAMSRFAGVWTGLKLMKDTVEVTSVVDGRPDRMSFVTPEFDMPPGGLNIRRNDPWAAQEARLLNHKRFASEAFAHANGIDRRVHGHAGARIGFVAAGKNWLDLTHAFGLLGIDADRARAMGVTTYKIGQTFPLDVKGFLDWAEGLDLIVVVEEKRKLIEVQIKEALFDDPRGRRVFGWHKGGTGATRGEELFPVPGVLDPVQVAVNIGSILIDEGRGTDEMAARLARLTEMRRADNATELASRTPYFCGGCPHNTSTVVPDGSRAFAGIGCHTLAIFMDRGVEGYTQMGAEGASWMGEAPFSHTPHAFQQMGDGTYNHSGVMAIRAAVAAGTSITFKILYNDAVALTGGQGNDGDLRPEQIAHELKALGLAKIAVVYDPKEEPDRAGFPDGIGWHDRSDLALVQNDLARVAGVTAILYIQTCAAEKRRRRKKGTFPDLDKRVFINPDICEGCGDCGAQSNCVSIVPLETELGRKRAIDQSSCNKDFSCLKGFCPSFVTVEGGTPRKAATGGIDLPDMPEPEIAPINGTHNIVITGIGGTGVVTIGAVIAMAAHLDGKGAGMMEMAGLSQKGGAVHIHCRLGERPGDISAIRVASGECDTLIGGDLVVSAGAKTIGLMRHGETQAIVNGHVVVTGAFTQDPEFRIPSDRLEVALRARVGDGLSLLDATALARTHLGDSIYSNMIVFGAAWQRGAVPVSRDAVREAIRLNGASVEANLMAFEIGRWSAIDPEASKATLTTPDKTLTLQGKIDFRATHLEAYQSPALARRYRETVGRFTDPAMQAAVAEGYHKVLAYKDEYEVARLLVSSREQAREAFEGDLKLTYHLAPPILSKTGPDGRPAKREFGRWLDRALPILAGMKRLRGTPFDLFGRTAERRMERALIVQYEADLAALAPDEARAAAIALARLPLDIRGFGPVKQANAAKAEARRAELLAALQGDAYQSAAE